MRDLHRMSDFDLYQARNMIAIISAAFPETQSMADEIEVEYKRRNVIAPISWDLCPGRVRA